MANTVFKDYIRNINGKVFLCVQGRCDNKKSYLNKHIECYRESEDGIALCRNLYYKNFTHSFFCMYSGEKFRYYSYGEQHYEYTQEWVESWIYNLPTYTMVTKRDIDNICKSYPNFIYTARKMLKTNPRTTVKDMFEALKIWKKHKEIEYFFNCGLYQACFSKSLYTMKKANQMKIYKYCNGKKNLDPSIKITEIKKLVSKNVADDEIKDYIGFFHCSPKAENSIEFYNYLRKQVAKNPTENIVSINTIYNDYLRLAKKANLDLTDPYHHYPSRLMERHNRLLTQEEAVKRAEDMKKCKEKEESYLKIARKWIDLNTDNFNGYAIFIPQNVKDIIDQANYLEHCLVRCDYISKVARKLCVLVFIQKNGVPVATAEINPNGNCIQFRGMKNRIDIVTKEKDLFEKWLKTHPIKWDKYEDEEKIA